MAIVTGAGAGIGKATALLLARNGARVTCNSLSTSGLQVVEQIHLGGGDALFVQGDMAEAGTNRSLVDKTIEAYGQVDFVFNNAGVVVPGTVETVSAADWDRQMAVNARGPFLLSKYALPHLRARRDADPTPCIVNCASVLALTGVKERAAYAASKGALLALTRAMAMDLVDDGIRVNAIVPGTTDTPSLAARLAEQPDPARARADFVARQPLKRLGTPAEIAEGVLYLIRANFCTGTCLTVDGGMTI